MKRAAHHKMAIKRSRKIDSAALGAFADQLGLASGPYYGGTEIWSPELADRFLTDAYNALRSSELEREKLKAEIRAGRRKQGPDKRALWGAVGTIGKAIEHSEGFPVARLEDARQTVIDYEEHMRVKRLAVHQIPREHRRPRASETERGKIIELAIRIARAAGRTKDEAKAVARGVFAGI